VTAVPSEWCAVRSLARQAQFRYVTGIIGGCSQIAP
jgi:hypothetical protein